MDPPPRVRALFLVEPEESKAAVVFTGLANEPWSVHATRATGVHGVVVLGRFESEEDFQAALRKIRARPDVTRVQVVSAGGVGGEREIAEQARRLVVADQDAWRRALHTLGLRG
ncbi:MAG: hypothetical protein ACT4PT_06015 [Methanobacteriota archaeon]